MPYIDASGVKINFPYDPYPCQIDYMKKVVESLQTGTNAILESPTGTGKTLCLLCASLAWLENKKAQIGNNRWKAANSGHELVEDMVKENFVSDYRNELSKMLDNAAGSWNGEMGAPKIIYASRTHSQLNQAMQEFKKTSYRYLRVCVIGSREQLCIHPQVSKEPNNTTKVHMCRAKVSTRSCHYANQVENFKSQAVDMVLDIEDLVGIGQKNNVCPYYLTKELKKDADLIFMPYNYLLDPKTRKAQGVELNGNILIFDEAHNLERICEESASFDFSSSDLAAAISDVNRILQKVQEWQSGEIALSLDSDSPAALDYSMEDVLAYKKCLLDFEEKVDSILISSEEGETYPGEKLFEILSEVGITLSTKSAFHDLTEKMVTTLAADSTNSVFTSRGGGLAKFGDVIQVVFTREPSSNGNFKSYIESASKHYKVHLKEEVKIRKKSDWGDNALQSVKKGRVLSYWCFNPGYTMADLKSNGVKVIVLTSGTLSPLQSFITEFGMDFPIRLENTHVIGQNQVWIGSLEKSPTDVQLSSTYENRSKTAYLEGLGHTIANLAKIIPKGVLVFFPSYPLMEKCLECWQSTGIKSRMESIKPVFVEPKGKLEFSLNMLGFYEKIQDPTVSGAIFMAVCRGKVSEGLDFADNNGRGVIITGLPYPPMMDARVKLKMQFLDELKRTTRHGLSGQDWYRLQASRAVNQAIGRVIRHKNDFGAILLCDVRFSKFTNELPVWLRQRMTICNNFGKAQMEVKKFFKPYESEIGNMVSIKLRTNGEDNSVPTGCSFELVTNKGKRVLKASTVIDHYNSINDNEAEDILAQYSKSAKIVSQPIQPIKGLLSALNSVEVLPQAAPGKLPKSEKLPTSSKRNIFSKTEIKSKTQIEEERSAVTSYANNLIIDIKRIYTNNIYVEFRKALTEHKADHDVDALIEKLEGLFDLRDSRNFFVIIGISKLIRPRDRTYFKELCFSKIGPSFAEAYNNSLSPVKNEPSPAKSPQRKRTKVESSKEKKSSQTLMKDFFGKSMSEPLKTTTTQGSSRCPANMDSKSHLQNEKHLSLSGMKQQPSSGSSGNALSLKPKMSSTAADPNGDLI